MTAVDCGILSFEAVFMPFMLTSDGRPLIERLAESDLIPNQEATRKIGHEKGDREHPCEELTEAMPTCMLISFFSTRRGRTGYSRSPHSPGGTSLDHRR
jgi:hypothetical protein